MDHTQSTQAYADTNDTQLTAVKRLKRGDVREDGRVFLSYCKNSKNGERWITREEYEKRKEYAAQYRAANRKKIAEACSQWREENKEYLREFYKKRRENNRERYKKYDRDRNERNKEKNKLTRRENYLKHRDHYIALSRKNREANPEKVRKAARESYRKNAEKRKEDQRAYRLRNIEKARKYFVDREREDEMYRFKSRIRSFVRGSFTRKGERKNTKTFNILGCDLAVLRSRFEKMFDAEMTWDNKGEWHIDHIVPLSAGKTGGEISVLCHHTNLRPMWGKDNITKRDNLPSQNDLPSDLDPRVRALFDRAFAASMQPEQ